MTVLTEECVMSGRTGRTIRLMLVDDHPVMRAGLANLLSCEPCFSVVAQANDARSALAGWREHRPDVCCLTSACRASTALRCSVSLRPRRRRRAC